MAIRSFSLRLQSAIENIMEGRTHGRELDEAFESGDGAAMAATLWKIGERWPRLAAKLPGEIGLPGDRPAVAALMGKTLAEIRQVAAAMRRGTRVRGRGTAGTVLGERPHRLTARGERGEYAVLSR